MFSDRGARYTTVTNSTLRVGDSQLAEGGEKRDPVTHRTKTQKRRDNMKAMRDPAKRADKNARRAARRKAVAAGKISKGSNLDIDHKDGNPRNNSLSNLRAVTRQKNRTTTGPSRKRTTR